MVAVALGTLVLGEAFSWRMVGAIAIILLGMFIVSRKKPAPAATPAAATAAASRTPAGALDSSQPPVGDDQPAAVGGSRPRSSTA
jgi:hypothetical protein